MSSQEQTHESLAVLLLLLLLLLCLSGTCRVQQQHGSAAKPQSNVGLSAQQGSGL
jgi:hypothetical protein